MSARGMLRWLSVLCVVVVTVSLRGPAFGRIKLITLPVRERVEIQLDNPNATLVEEERIVPLLKGLNHVDFSWSNSRIDKWSIQFRVIEMPTRAKRRDDPASLVGPDGRVERIRVVDVAYPPGENALVWQVYAEEGFAARIRISYIIAGLTRMFDYRAVAEHDESTLVLRKYIRLDNLCGEEFGEAGIWAGFGPHFLRPVGMNEAKRMLLWKFERVPIVKTYTFDWWSGATVPDQPEQRYVLMHYELTNDRKNNMGDFPLQPGKVRIFQKDGHGANAFIGEDWAGFTPIDDVMKLYLGLARDIEVKRKVTRNLRHPGHGRPYTRELIVHYTIRNFKNTAVTLDIREDMNRLRDEFCGKRGYDAEWEVVRKDTTLAEAQVERINSRTAVYHVPLPAAPKDKDAKVETHVVTVHILFKNEL